ncbi:hypothetical protein [Streptomyces sp. NPDC057509]
MVEDVSCGVGIVGEDVGLVDAALVAAAVVTDGDAALQGAPGA